LIQCQYFSIGFISDKIEGYSIKIMPYFVRNLAQQLVVDLCPYAALLSSMNNGSTDGQRIYITRANASRIDSIYSSKNCVR
jgi:hypothetical protein